MAETSSSNEETEPSESDYAQAIADLAAGKRQELKIDPPHFAVFQRAFHKATAAKQIEGMAQHNGLIIYRKIKQDAS